MKKIVVLIMLVIATSTFAMSPVKYKTLYKLNNEVTFNSMVRYLNVDENQQDQLKYVFSKTEKKLRKALKNDDLVAATNVLNYNLGNTKYILTEDQYKKYLAVLNVSIYNSYYTELVADNN